jgi:hypothetical protein
MGRKRCVQIHRLGPKTSDTQGIRRQDGDMAQPKKSKVLGSSIISSRTYNQWDINGSRRRIICYLRRHHPIIKLSGFLTQHQVNNVKMKFSIM